MIRCFVVAGLLSLLVPAAPAFAVTPQQKMATCQFGADDQKLEGKERVKFIKNCMSSRNDPRGGSGQAAPPKN
jgi:hypothetical protein